MPDYDEMLKAIGDKIEESVYYDRYKDEKPRQAFLNLALERKHILAYHDPQERKVFLQLTPEGRLYLKEKYQKWYRKPEWWGIIVSGAIGAAGLAVALLKP